jgi:hypothetical protein
MRMCVPRKTERRGEEEKKEGREGGRVSEAGLQLRS